jgi:putative glutamine amidotransferase
MIMKIGLTRTENDEKHQFYIDWLKGRDDIEIVTLSPGSDTNTKDLDALVLSGGWDIHPDFYKGRLSYDNAPGDWKKERDAFETALLNAALDKNIPVLGICRGLQVINVALGGTLIQDLGNERNALHKGDPDKKHTVTIEKNTILHAITSVDSAETNSAHHQAIGNLANGLIVNARSADNTIEGIEWKDPTTKPFLLAVQWHPERMFKVQLEHSPASQPIRERFIQEIKKANKNHT